MYDPQTFLRWPSVDRLIKRTTERQRSMGRAIERFYKAFHKASIWMHFWISLGRSTECILGKDFEARFGNMLGSR